MKHGVAFIPINYSRGLVYEGRKCPPPLTVFADMPADYNLGNESYSIAVPSSQTWTRQTQRLTETCRKKAPVHILFLLTIQTVSKASKLSFCHHLQTVRRFYVFYNESTSVSHLPCLPCIVCLAVAMKVITLTPFLFCRTAGCGSVLRAAAWPENH